MEPRNAPLRDLAHALNARGVEYLVVGGSAVHRYVAAREPDDVTLWVRPGFDNVARAARAVHGFDPQATAAAVFRGLYGTGHSVHLAHSPTGTRFDLVTRLRGEAGFGGFGAAWDERAVWALRGVPANYLSLAHLTAAVKASRGGRRPSVSGT